MPLTAPFHVKHSTIMEGPIMDTDIQTVEIPLDVRDNSQTVTDYAFMRHRSPDRGVVGPDGRDRENRVKREYLSHMYTYYAWSDVNPDGQRCRFDMWVSKEDGQVVNLFHTEHWTRVVCCTHDAYYADCYASVSDEDGCTTIAAPYCDECLHHLRRSAKDTGMTLNLSERLLTGQHD